MENGSAPICAAIDVGSNTIHIVVARCFPGRLEILADELELVRIGESVTATGTISAEKCQTALTTLKRYQALAEHYAAERIFVVATEAIRQASNNAAFFELVRTETGLDVYLITGVTEATLTFLGATYEAGGQGEKGVMDLGGGSLELVFANHMPLWRTSVPVGSGWLHDHYLPANPPTLDAINAAEAFLRTYFRGIHLPHTIPALIVTGGSANSLLRLAHKAFHHPQEDKTLSLEDLTRCYGLLSALSAEDIAHTYEQPLERAKLLLAGTLIIKHIMKVLKVREITVSQHGIREGLLLAYARYGENWLIHIEQEELSEERFAQTARKTLVERLHAMISWSDEVLKHQDSEAVHKMRVASRRLRAALDAYQPCCDPVLFPRIYRQVNRTAKLLGEARDTDVMLNSLSQQLDHLSQEEQAGVRWLLTGLHTYRQQKQRELEKLLRKLNSKKLKRRLERCVREKKD